MDFLPFEATAVAGGAAVFALVAQVDLLDVQAAIGHFHKSIPIQVVHARVLVPPNGRLGVALGRAVQQNRRALQSRDVFRLNGELGRN